MAAFGWLTLVGCGFGLLVGIAPGYLAIQRKALMRGRVERPGSLFLLPWLVTILGVVAVACAVAGMVQLVDLVSPGIGALGRRLLMLLGAACVGAATTPLLAVPLALMDPDTPRGLRSALWTASSVASAAPRQAAALGAAHAVFFLAPVVLATAFSGGTVFVAMTLMGALSTSLLAYGIARFYAARRPAGFLEVERVEGERGVGGSFAMAALAGALVLGVLGHLSSSPLSPPLEDPRRCAPSGQAAAWMRPLPIRLPGTSVQLRARAGGLSVEAADGGGAGFVAFVDGLDVTAAGVDPAEASQAPEGGPWRVHLRAGAHCASLCLGAGGVRCDDSWSQRLRRRVWLGASVPLAFACFFLLRVSRRHLGDWLLRSRLHDVRDGGEWRGMRALTGRLRLRAGGEVIPGPRGRRSRADVAGDVRLDAGDLVVRLPPGSVRTIVTHADRLKDGELVTVVGAFPRLVAGGFREATVELDGRYWLVPGDLREAEVQLVAKTAREAVVSLTFASLGLFVTAFALLVASGV